MPIDSAVARAASTAIPMTRTVPVPDAPSGMKWVRIAAATIPAILAVTIIARFRPPLNKAIIIAMDRIPNSGTWKAIDCRFAVLKNLPGSINEKTPMSTTRITSR